MGNNNQLFRNDLYTIKSLEEIDPDSFKVTVALNTAHKIFKVHFPGNPITPGACVMQIATEILSSRFEKNLIMSEAKNIKFINLINPVKDPEVDFIFKVSSVKEDSVSVSIRVCRDTETFVKISAAFTVYKNE